jgi:hypothetical protein
MHSIIVTNVGNIFQEVKLYPLNDPYMLVGLCCRLNLFKTWETLLIKLS